MNKLVQSLLLGLIVFIASPNQISGAERQMQDVITAVVPNRPISEDSLRDMWDLLQKGAPINTQANNCTPYKIIFEGFLFYRGGENEARIQSGISTLLQEFVGTGRPTAEDFRYVVNRPYGQVYSYVPFLMKLREIGYDIKVGARTALEEHRTRPGYQNSLQTPKYAASIQILEELAR